MKKAHGQHWSPAIKIGGLSAAATPWLPLLGPFPARAGAGKTRRAEFSQAKLGRRQPEFLTPGRSLVGWRKGEASAPPFQTRGENSPLRAILFT